MTQLQSNPSRLPVHFAEAETPVIWLESEQVICASLSVPPVAEKKWRGMLPWLLEEKVLGSTEKLTIRGSARHSNGCVDVVAVEESLLSSVRQSDVVSEKLSGAPIVADFYALPYVEGEVSVLTVADRMIVRDGFNSGFAGHREFIQQLLNTGPDEQSKPVQDYSAGNDSGASLFNRLPPHYLPLDQPQKRIGFSHRLSAGTALMAMSLVCFFLWVLNVYLETHQMEKQAVVMDEQMLSAYQQMFGASYDGNMEDFQRRVSDRLTESEPDLRWQSIEGALGNLQRWMTFCHRCQVRTLEIDDRTLRVGVEGPSEQSVAELKQFRVEAEENGWRFVAPLQEGGL